MKISNMCLMCKGGRALCGNTRCPLLSKVEAMPKVMSQMKSREFFGPSTSIFVGRVGYPNVNVGAVGALGHKELVDSPEELFGMEYNKVIELRSLTLRSKVSENVKSKSKMVEDNQLLAMASKPTDIEMNFKKEPTYKFSFSDVSAPMGPSALLDKMKIIDNIKISRKVDYIVNDDLKSQDQCYSLYQVGIDIHKVMNILSSGALGTDENKKMVPTRWSITAFDDMIAKRLIDSIKDFPEINGFEVFESEYLGNHFVIILMPGKWEFENFEAWSPGSTWAQGAKEVQVVGEYEPFEGRKDYAELQAGGYYASRFSIVQHLYDAKRQARVIAIREISEKYVVPLGVWVVRSTVKNAFENSPVKFDSLKKALDYAGTRIGLPMNQYITQSKLLRQKRLFDFV